MIYVCGELEKWTSRLFTQQLDRVPKFRREHILKLAQPLSRYQSLTGWLLLSYAYEREYGRPLPQIRILPQGKPVFTHEAEGYFSLSHSGNLVCCALGQSACGMDIQEVRRVRPGVIARCCNDREIQQLENAKGESEQSRLFALLWSRKEAMCKLDGLGIAQDLKSAGWCEDFGNGLVRGFSCMVTPDAALSLCYRGEKDPVREQIIPVSLSSLFCKESF